MRFALSEEQRQFADSLHDLLTAADLPSVIRRWGRGDHDPGLEVWRKLGDLGVTGLAVPEDFGGLAASPVDLVVAFEQLGRHAVPGPVVESLAVVPTLLAGPAGGEHSRRWLPALADGKAVASLAFPPHLRHALDADIADLVLHVDGDGVRLATPGACQSSVDFARRLFTVTPGELVASEVPGRAFDIGVLCASAQLLGLGQALLERTTEYAKQRVQFGKPIGSFQAVKHQLADVLVGLELARPLLYGAAIALGDGALSSTRDVSAAKIAANEAAYRAVRTALQVHGALGYTEEYDLSLWLTKVRALTSAWGTEPVHLERVTAALAADRAASP